MKALFPSLISADILNLESVIKKLDPHCHGYHIDIMDNHFVPNLTWGAQFTNAIAQITKKQIWAHLMVDNPSSIIEKMSLPVGSIVSFHFETKNKIKEVVLQIKEKKWRPSIAISPKTGITESFERITHLVDHLLIMSVEPGFSGQKFIPETIQKAKQADLIRKKNGIPLTIGMDGGINQTNIAACINAGVEHFAIASGIFSKNDPAIAVQQLTRLISKT